MNHKTNEAYGAQSRERRQPGYAGTVYRRRYDYVCESVHSRLGEPMRKYCRNLHEEVIKAGHWVAQEKPLEVNAALVKWLATSVPNVWPRPA